MNTLANAIELATATVTKMNSDDVKTKVDIDLVRTAVTNRLQRRLGRKA